MCEFRLSFNLKKMYGHHFTFEGDISDDIKAINKKERLKGLYSL